uniref:Uncharacterized protein n=1 Tax=Rhizophora mucronata TaxID=61149 RepID=A0A2P2N3J3_RHIMU
MHKNSNHSGHINHQKRCSIPWHKKVSTCLQNMSQMKL